METELQVARSELVMGGQRSGKSRRAETLAAAWLRASPAHRAVLVATARPWDAEMRERILRHQQDRALRVPALVTVEEPVALANTLRRHSHAQTLVLVDCLTLWLTNLRMPAPGMDDRVPGQRPDAAEGVRAVADPPADDAAIVGLLELLGEAPGPLVLVGNEIGLGVVPMGAQVRSFVDALGRLNQAVAQRCARVTLMVAGLPLTLKDS